MTYIIILKSAFAYNKLSISLTSEMYSWYHVMQKTIFSHTATKTNILCCSEASVYLLIHIHDTFTD